MNSELPLESVSTPHQKDETTENSGVNIVTPNESTPLINNGTEPPLAQPENDLDEALDPPTITISQPESTDGFLYEERNVHDIPSLSDRAGTFPYAPGFGPGIASSTITAPESIPDVNIYQQKKTVAQGMMDLALFSANANQLRYVLESSSRHAYYYSGIVLISFSLILQVAIGVGLLWNTRYNVKDEKEICIANKVNNFTIVAIFLVTVLNVFISAFGTTAGVPVT